MTLKKKMNSMMITAGIKAKECFDTFAEEERGDFAQYALLIIIVVAIAGIVSNALTGWVGTVMDSLTNFSAN
ncbi:MAG: hypothetical protein KH268_06210 [Clostridiales bacterium]|nr:hypothetical protein [Clostridiales bacterium]